MIYLWLFLAGVAAAFGLPLVVIGLIVLLCEMSWGKRTSNMGSVALLGGGGVLCLPALLLAAIVLFDRMGLLRRAPFVSPDPKASTTAFLFLGTAA
jgi:hypothetical protein